jgi:hypothetical protein
MASSPYSLCNRLAEHFQIFPIYPTPDAIANHLQDDKDTSHGNFWGPSGMLARQWRTPGQRVGRPVPSIHGRHTKEWEAHFYDFYGIGREGGEKSPLSASPCVIFLVLLCVCKLSLQSVPSF